MAKNESVNLATFEFRGIHPYVFMGTASDRYAGWVGQIYPEDRYGHRTTRRSKTVGDKPFVEEVLPVESVASYFEHFRVLELDFTYYRPLLDKAGKPTTTYHVLQSYRRHMTDDNHLLLKAPQTIFAQKLRHGGRFVENREYLNPEVFTRQFYEPAVALLGPCLRGFIFEQEYQRKEEHTSAQEHAAALDSFFQNIPKDKRYHVEIRTPSLLGGPLFAVFEKYGIGQVLSHWTWLPSLRRQFALSGGVFLNAAEECIVRLMTPRGTRYEDAYAQAYPFNGLVEGMLSKEMVEETAEIMWDAVEQGVRIYVIVNNRAGGNAPLIARVLAARFLELGPQAA
jgi:uncharacterized protein YecE (DUF72 family)